MQDDWIKTYLGNEIALLYGKALPKRNRIEGEYPVFGSNGIVGFHDEALVNGPGIIVGRKGSCGAVHFSTSDFWPIDTTYYIALRKGHYWPFMSFFLRTFGLSEMNSHSTIPGLNREDVYKLECHIPPPPEQQKIAAILFEIQQAIEIQESIIERMQELKKATMQHVFTYGLRGDKTKETEIGRVPESWEVVRLEGVCQIERGKFTHRPRNDPAYYGGTIPFVQTGDVANSNGRIKKYSQTLNELGLSVSKIFSAGTILITIAANIGDTGILVFDSAFPDSIVGLTPNEKINGCYVEYYLRTQKQKMMQLAPKGTQMNINIQFLKPWPVPLPSKGEQDEIAKTFQIIDTKIELHEAKESVLQDLFKTMLNKLMTGKIRVKDLEVAISKI